MSDSTLHIGTLASNNVNNIVMIQVNMMNTKKK